MEKPPIRLVQKNEETVWDCGSSLYDSFELDSLHRQLDSALSARSLSMTHLSGNDHRPHSHRILSETKEHSLLPPMAPSRVSRSLLKLLRSVFKTRPLCTGSSGVRTCSSYVKRGDEQSKLVRECYHTDRVLAMDDKRSCSLATIPEEAPESPEICAFVRRTASARFSGKHYGLIAVATQKGILLNLTAVDCRWR